ncbi:hypothetical protein [Alkalihalobacillus trypoxylicola]|uniref:Uncharacterized protein n=1 Tax=Alkalihalobacillus trypoxylicola TaxID=519424 RepID=A0A161P3C2_9BACI|nr:hypothetical protein [Alkalihalobacillus trypoxylicola]KYG26013.1 hypothetical protein AZF04_13075 [Alkalihalobacillus trypoxylicola]
MKKIIIFMLLSLLFLSACNFSVDVDDGNEEEPEDINNEVEETNNGTEEDTNNEADNTTDNGKEPIELKLSQADEEAGVTTENNELFQELNDFVEQNPDAGTENDFSMTSMTMIQDPEGNQQMIFLGFNRLGESIKNVSFSYSLGNTEGDMVWDNFEVLLDEEMIGAIPNNTAIPVALPITSQEQIDLLNTLSQENVVMQFDNFNYESAD